MKFDYSLESMLPFARAALTTSSDFRSFSKFCDSLFGELQKAQIPGVVPNPPHGSALYRFNYTDLSCPRVLQLATIEVFCHLLHRGFIAPEGQMFPATIEGASYWRTKKGEAWARGAEPLPEDVDGYMRHLSALAPTLDTVIIQYVQEGLGSFHRGAFFSAAVMLGAASEKEIYLLGWALVGALKDAASQKKLSDQLKGRSLYSLLKSISTQVALCKKPLDVFDGAELHLMSLFDSIRVQRNDAVHPNTANVNENSVRLSYDAFPQAIRKAEALRGWFDQNPQSL